MKHLTQRIIEEIEHRAKRNQGECILHSEAKNMGLEKTKLILLKDWKIICHLDIREDFMYNHTDFSYAFTFECGEQREERFTVASKQFEQIKQIFATIDKLYQDEM